MTNSNNSISVTYSDEKLHILVEEYITQQRTEFTFKGVCSYILYWAMDEGCVSARAEGTRSLCRAQAGSTEGQERTNSIGLYDSDELAQADCDRVSKILEKMVAERRIVVQDSGFVKAMN